MFLTMYRSVLRGPQFRGCHRIASLLRGRFVPASDSVYGGVRMNLDPLEWLQVSLMAGDPQEPLTADLFARLLQRGDTLVDIGAHVGWLSLIGAKAVGPTGTVVAIDPQPYNCDRILTNAELNGFENVIVVAGAVGETNALIRLPNQSASDKARLTLAGPGVNDTGLSFLTQSITLPVLIDMLGLGPIKMLKVDVEGFELPVFRAAAAILANVENVVFEQLPENETDFAAIRGILQDAGFELRTVEGAPIDGGKLPENNIWARREA